MLTISKLVTGNNYHNSLIATVLRRYLNTIYETEVTVTPFCNINVKLPFNITAVPLDIHKYKDYNKVIVKLSTNDNSLKADLQCDNINDNVNLFTTSDESLQGVTCYIQAPIKANLNVTTLHGHIELGSFNGENINVTTTSGNVTASKCHCNKIHISSSGGNILCNGVMQAAEIELKTKDSGSIITSRLQGLLLKAETENGNIETDSSYCNDSSFSTINGHLDLRNTHKNCKVSIANKGLLNMTGFDGTLQVYLKKGNANIQIARIHSNSEICIEESGTLLLKLFDTCIQNTSFKIITNDLRMNDDVDFNRCNSNDHLLLTPHGDTLAEVAVHCQKSNVEIQNTTFMEMFSTKNMK